MANKVDRNNFANYLKEARSWETDKVNALKKSAKTAWLVAISAGVLALISGVAIAVLGPQKTAVPYVIRVNDVTGAVDIVSALKNGDTNYDEVMNKYHVQWYVRWREGYSKHLIDEYYKNVGLMSAADEQLKYSALINPKNPNSPINTMGDHGVANIKIQSTSFIKDDVALVRYTKEISNGGNSSVTHWAATITFLYASTPMSEQDRAINPLGFQVVEYRNDPDQEISGSTLSINSARPQVVTSAPATPAVPPIQ